MLKAPLARSTLVVAAILATAGIALAQPITVTNNGEKLAGAEISAVINGIKRPLGTTDANGQITIDMNQLNIPKGTEVSVWIRTCQDGKVELVLTLPGQESECTRQNAEVGQGCGCDPLPLVIWWGEGPVTIDIGRHTVDRVESGRGSTWSRLSLGLAAEARYMLNLEDVAGQAPGATGASATTWAPGVEVFADWRLAPWFRVGIDASYASMEAGVTFPEGIQTSDIRYYELGGNVKLGPYRARIRPYVTMGLFGTWNKIDLDLEGESEYRLHKTWRGGFGGGVDYHPKPNLGLRLEGLYSTTFEDDDADEHVRWKFGVLFNPPGGGPYAF